MTEIVDYLFDGSKLNERTIQMYERRIRNGEKLASIVLRAHEGGYEVIDGFHRLAAMKRCGLTEMSCFVCGCTPDDAAKLRRELNEL